VPHIPAVPSPVMVSLQDQEWFMAHQSYWATGIDIHAARIVCITEAAAAHGGPVLLDTLTYRYSGHSPSDADSYRTQEEKDTWAKEDSILAFKTELILAGLAKAEDFAAIDETVIRSITEAVRLAIDPAVSPRMSLAKTPDAIEKIMFSNQRQPKMEDRPIDMLQTRDENLRVQQLAKKARFAYDESGKPVSKNKVYQLRDGIFEAVIDKFYEDPTLVAYGEENRDWGGAFAVYRGMTEALLPKPVLGLMTPEAVTPAASGAIPVLPSEGRVGLCRKIRPAGSVPPAAVNCSSSRWTAPSPAPVNRAIWRR